MRELMKQLSPDHLAGLAYTNGKRSADAGDRKFQVYGLQGWHAEMGD